MKLSPEREADLIEKNMPKIYRAIDNFMARRNKSGVIQLSYDDCVQEVSLAFLQYIRRCETEDQLNKFPWYDAMHALSELVLVNQPLTVPRSTRNFRNIIHSMPRTVPFDILVSMGIEVDGLSKHWVPDKDTEMDFSQFMSGQTEFTRRITSMRIFGMTYRDIAAECGVSKSMINKYIGLLREKYEKFNGEESDDE